VFNICFVYCFIIIKFFLYAEHCVKISLHKILGNILCWTLSEYLFTHNTGKYVMLSTVGGFIYLHTVLSIKYSPVICVNKSSHCAQPTVFPSNLWKEIFPECSTWSIPLVFCVNKSIFIYTQYWEIRYVEYCGKIYLQKIPRNIVCWALWENLLTQNTEEYCMLFPSIVCK
jgi:hypothetical protein